MKNYKQEAIEAIEEFINMKYKLPITGLDFGYPFCSLCGIYRKEECETIICNGCVNMVFKNPYACKRFRCVGCENSRTFYNLKSDKTIENRNIRRKFWQIVLPKLKDIPAKYFTPKGFEKEVFKFMIDIDTKLYEMRLKK